MTRTLCLLLGGLAAACSAAAAGPPEIVIDRTACSHCSMLISEPRYAAAYQVAGAAPRVFDDIGCLLQNLPAEAGSHTDVTFWFQDDHGGWIDGADATFVASPEIRTPMGGGIIAFRDGAAADRAAAAHRGERIATLARLRLTKGDTR